MSTRKPKAAVSPIAICVAAILPLLQAQAANAAVAKGVAESRSKGILTAIAALFAAFTDLAEYQAAVVKVFGNGSRKKDEKVIGELGDALIAAKVSDLSVAVSLSHARTVAANWGKAAVVKAAESGLRKAYDAAKPAKVEAAKDAGAGTTKTVGDIEMMMLIIERNGPKAVLGMIESALTAKADVIHAGYVHEAKVKFGS
jgi:hypothetical protein